MQKPKLNLLYELLPSREVSEDKTELLIQLHGVGSNKEDLFSFAHMLPKKYTILSAQAPIDYFGGFAWYNLYPGEDGFISNIPEAKESLKAIKEFIENAITAFDAKPKVTLLGFSQGAILSLATTLNNPNLIDKVIALSGYLNNDLIDKELKENKIPIFATHGTQDEVITIDKAKKTYQFFEENNYNFQFKSYPMAHGVSPECLQDVISFLS